MPLRDDLLTPIPGDNPGGSSLRYDPVTDKVKEARREDLDVPQGEWKSALKTADNAQVIKLASEAIAKRGKDLQLAAWLVEAHAKRDGFAILPECFRFLKDLCDQFWDTLYPEIEEGDLEVRAAPLEWLGTKLEEPLRRLPVVASGLGWISYKESRSVGYETDTGTDEKRKLRKQLIEDGKITGEEFDQAVDDTPKSFYENLGAQLAESLETLEELTTLLDEKFGSVSPSFIKVRTALEEVSHFQRSCMTKKGGSTQKAAPPPPPPSPEPAAAAAAVAPAPPVQAATPVYTAAATSGPGSIDPADVEDVARRLAAIARFLRAKDAYDISAYLIPRAYRWGEIRYNGPEIDDSLLVPPEDDMRRQLESAFNSQQWDRVLDLTEEAMQTACGRGWLDLQRYTAKALEGKGQWFDFVGDAIRTGVRGLIQDLPGLLDRSLRDGSPTADAATRAWIEGEVMAGTPIRQAPARSSSASGGTSRESEEEPAAAPAIDLEVRPPEIEAEPLTRDAPSEEFDLALEAARAGRCGEALEILNKKLATERSGRGRFARRVQIAHLLVAAGREGVAQPILDGLAAEIDARQLEEWELGEAIAYPLSLLLRCSDQDEEARRRTYARLCRLDPVRALDVSQ